jgi:hypothetical protein
MVNFARHIHVIDPRTYCCRICGIGEIDLFTHMVTADEPMVLIDPDSAISAAEETL